LSAFSGPVEGIILIIVIYIITGAKGPGFWDQGVLTVMGVDHTKVVQRLNIKNLPLNELFLTFGAIGMIFNIVARYVGCDHEVRRSFASTAPAT
jgi:ethanolaminephosphotransferase